MPTLLAELATLLAHSPENVATEALTLILTRSRPASGAVERLASEWSGLKVGPNLTWRSQAAAEDHARPDLEGSDNGRPVVILENKFWAGLTEKQGSTYLNRLPSNGGVLAFIVPSARIKFLKTELTINPNHIGELPNSTREIGESWIATLASGRTLAITSWKAVLTAIAQALEAAQEFATLADLGQLQGLADRMDRDGFQPFTITDLTGNAASLVLRSCDLVKSAVFDLGNRPFASKKGLQASGGEGWYCQRVALHGYGCRLYFTAWRWNKYHISPIWLNILGGSWEVLPGLGELIRGELGKDDWPTDEADGAWVPIQLPQGREEKFVLDAIVSQVESVASVLSSRPLNSVAASGSIATDVTPPTAAQMRR